MRERDESEWIKIPDHHTPIISKELFELAKSKIRKFKLPNKKERNFPLRGKVFCGCCDHALNVVNGRHYKCKYSEKISELDCHSLSIPIKELEAVVFDTLHAQTRCVIGSVDLKGSVELSTAQQAEHNKKLRGLQDSKRELYESLVLGEISEDDYKARKSELDALIAEMKNVIAAAAAGANSTREKYEESLRQKKVAGELNTADSLTKSLVELMIKRVYVFPDNRIEIEYLSSTPFEN